MPVCVCLLLYLPISTHELPLPHPVASEPRGISANILSLQEHRAKDLANNNYIGALELKALCPSIHWPIVLRGWWLGWMA